MAEIDRDKLLDVYTRTMKVNRTDEKFRELLMQGKVAVMYYCVRGQELVSAAAILRHALGVALDDRHDLALDGPLVALLKEIFLARDLLGRTTALPHLDPDLFGQLAAHLAGGVPHGRNRRRVRDPR